MSWDLWFEMITGAADAILTGADAFNRVANHQEHGRIDRLADESGWKIRRRKGNRHFLDLLHPGSNRRYTLAIIDGDEAMPIFVCRSKLALPADRFPPQLAGTLLQCNNALELGAWEAVVDQGTVTLAVTYRAFGWGLHADIFQHICGVLVHEVAEFDLDLARRIQRR